MTTFKISIIDRLVTSNESGVELPLLKIEVPMPLFNEMSIVFFELNGNVAFEVVRAPEDPIEDDEDVIKKAFIEWRGASWDPNNQSVEYYNK